jgi:competence protein ComGC
MTAKNETKLVRSRSSRQGLTLIEILAAVMIASLVAVLGVRYTRPAGESAKQHTCDLTRQILQNDANRYQETTGNLPSRDLSELENSQYSGVVLPTCPITGEAYSLERNGTVACPTHESTRE